MCLVHVKEAKKEGRTYDIEKGVAARGDGPDQFGTQCTVILLFEALSAA